ncbi:MAG: helix-turn-helix domain-containing protein [Candidatus Moraniibacteriota bacterium]
MKRQSKPKEKASEILTLQEACDILHCHPNTLRNWDNKGFLKAIRFGTRGDRRYRRDDILKLLRRSI